jgi:hypothetical protein
LGFKAGRAHSVTLTLQGDDGAMAQYPDVLAFSTDPLPADFPPLRIDVAEPEAMEPGLTLFAVRPRIDKHYFVVVDEFGEVVWFVRKGAAEVRQFAGGEIAYINQDQIHLMNAYGDSVGRYYGRTFAEAPEDGIFVDTSRFHHEVFPMTNGNFVALSKEARTVDDFPTSEVDRFAPTERRNVNYDVVVEFSPTGAVEHAWNLFDVLDPYRMGYDSLQSWGHSNGVIHDPSDDSFIISLRHQDAVIKIDRTTATLKWILGPHGNWKPEWQPYLLSPVGEPFEWFHHQHAPTLTGDGHVILFDNGNHRAQPPDPPLPPEANFSRAVEYSIDEQAMEVSQTWEYRADAAPRLYSDFQGDADWLPVTGNRLVTFAAITFVDGLPVDENPVNSFAARIVELDSASPARVVFQIALEDDVQENGGWTVARSQRIGSLYGN